MSETPTGWQPIETAPRDGRTLLLWDASREVGILGCWSDEWGGWEQEESYLEIPQPTHWMLIEPSPAGGDAISEHTPGPWRYKADGGNYMRIFCHNDEGWGDNLCGYCGEANARLIAAAPDLLEALTALLSYTRACEDMLNATTMTIKPNSSAQIRRARVAIEKATGNLKEGRDE